MKNITAPKSKKLFNQLILFILFLAIVFPYINYAKDDRDSWQQPVKIMDAIKIKSGMIVGEAGAGEGYFTFHLSKRVGKTGHVYANDIFEKVLKTINNKCKEENIKNITTVLGEVDNPLFPEGKLDIVVMMNAFHDFTKQVEWMENVIPGMKPEANLVIIDRKPDKAGYGHDHFMTKDEILQVMAKTKFKLVKIETFLKKDNIYIFELKKNVE